MRKTLLLLHLLAFSALLGSIIGFIVIASHHGTQDLKALAFTRDWIALGTHRITVPALWVLVASGVALSFGLRPWPTWLRAKLAVVAAIALNTHLLIVPAVDQALIEATQAAQTGVLGPAYVDAYRVETLAGSCNVLLILAAMALAVWRPVWRDARRITA